ncbi:MAG: hypothetical protein ABJR05_08665 [Balneola sp.]
MDKIVRKCIVDILSTRNGLLKIPVRQRAKFEGCLKFELASHLEKIGAENVEVESKAFHRRDRTDITFFWQEEPYSLELKTSNTNWKIDGVNSSTRPITKNIKSIVKDAEKLNSESGIVAFVLFPIPLNDNRWEFYIDRISNKTGIEISPQNNCSVLSIDLNEN